MDTVSTFPRLARANALLDELQAPPAPPVWTPPRRPSTLVAPILDVTGMYTRAHTVGKATLVDEHPGTIPLLIRHKAELGVHGVVLRLERDTTGTLWATCHVDDHAGCLVRSGDYTELSPALLGDGHNWAGDDGVDYTELADATIVEVSLVEASASRIGRAHVTPTDVTSSRNGTGFDWPDSHRRCFERAHDALRHQRTSTVLAIGQAPDPIAEAAARRQAEADRLAERYPELFRRNVPSGGLPQIHRRYYPNAITHVS